MHRLFRWDVLSHPSDLCKTALFTRFWRYNFRMWDVGGISMDESEIEKLFMRVAGNAGKVPEDVLAVFSMLVSSTLSYRDQVKATLGIILTVEDVQVVLNWLFEALHTKRLPETNSAVRLDLLKIWLDGLNPYW